MRPPAPRPRLSRCGSLRYRRFNRILGARMFRSIGALALMIAIAPLASPVRADDAQVERGKYLATIGDCIDCHTQGYFFAKPDMTRYLGGSRADHAVARAGQNDQARSSGADRLSEEPAT